MEQQQQSQPQRDPSKESRDGGADNHNILYLKEKEPLPQSLNLGPFTAGVTSFLSGFTFPRNKKKISMTNSLGKRRNRKNSCCNADRGSYGLLGSAASGEDLRNSNKIKSSSNLSGYNTISSSRERRLSSSSATMVKESGRKSDGNASRFSHDQPHPREAVPSSGHSDHSRKLVRIIDHQLDW